MSIYNSQNNKIIFIIIFITLVSLLHYPAFASQPTFTVSGIGGSGGIHCMTIAPYDKNFILFSSDMGGAFRSLDGGRSWELIHFSQGLSYTQFSPQAVMLPHRTYWVTSRSRLCYSDDQAKTWTILPAGPWEKVPLESKKKNNIVSFAALPGSEEKLLVSATKGLWIGKDTDWRQVHDEDGGPVVVSGNIILAAAGKGTILRSDDIGKSWKPLSALPDRVAALSMAMDPAGQSLIMASVDYKGIYRSKDMGVNWEICKSPFEKENIVIIPQGQTTLIYAAQTTSSKNKQILRSRDGGKSWDKIFRMPSPGKERVPGDSVEPSFMQRRLYWGYFICHNAFSVAANDHNTAIFGTQGEAFITKDGGESWTPVHTRPLASLEPGVERYRSIGLEVTANYNYYTDPNEPERAYICYADIGFARSLDKGASWAWSANGSPWKNVFYELAFDPLVPGKIYAAATSRHEIFNYLGTGLAPKKIRSNWGGVVVSDNFGASWKTPYTRKKAGALPEQVCSSVILDLASPPANRTLFAGIYGEDETAGVYLSHDSGKTWEQTPGQPGVLPNRHIGRLRLHPETDDLYCLVTGLRSYSPNHYNPDGGGLWRSQDRGKTWEHLTKGSQLCQWATDFAFDPKDKNIIYVTAANPPGKIMVGGVYLTKDAGKTWTQTLDEKKTYRVVNVTKYNEGFMAVAVHPKNPELVFCGTATSGLFVSKDHGKNWIWCKDFPSGSVQAISFDQRDTNIMYVSTMGAGVWKASLKLLLERL